MTVTLFSGFLFSVVRVSAPLRARGTCINVPAPIQSPVLSIRTWSNLQCFFLKSYGIQGQAGIKSGNEIMQIVPGTNGIVDFIWKGKVQLNIALRNKQCSISSILSLTMAQPLFPTPNQFTKAGKITRLFLLV